jgi:catechol 2,3-dioxygenase-like lactoylglutathione lyase family enzyme
LNLRPLLRSVLAFVLVSAPLGAQTSPPINGGLAHVAISVANVARSREFYGKLGFDEAFHFGEGDAVTQSFLKVNDRQFIELYPSSEKQPVGFLHLCFEGTLEPLNAFYASRGLNPKPVRKARAGNLLFTMEGPETTNGKQNIEYTQYMPGSLHWEDRGKHLNEHPLVTEMFAVSIAMRDRVAAHAYYTDKLDFPEMAGHPWLLEIPGPTHEQVLLRNDRLGTHSEIFLLAPNFKDAANRLKAAGIPAGVGRGTLTVTDPDGNLLVIRNSPVAE